MQVTIDKRTTNFTHLRIWKNKQGERQMVRKIYIAYIDITRV